MTKNILIISSSRADRSLLEPIANKLGNDCEFIKITPLSWECCRSTLNVSDKGKKVILLGDRWETLLLAFRATELYDLVYHIHGGEETVGSRDNLYRHAITKLSHVHITSHKDFADRVAKMGEPKENIFSPGSLGVWRAKKIRKRYRGEGRFIPLEKMLSVIIHPNTIEPDKTEYEITTLLKSLKQFIERFRIKFYVPNHDNGREIIERKIRAFCELYEQEYIEEEYGNDFLNSLASSKCIIGNSSCGIIEAPTLGVPTVNIGERQNGRPRAKSVINTSFNQANIERAIKMALENKFDFTNPYDNVEHDTVDMICKIIQNHPVEFKKRFMD